MGSAWHCRLRWISLQPPPLPPIVPARSLLVSEAYRNRQSRERAGADTLSTKPSGARSNIFGSRRSKRFPSCPLPAEPLTGDGDFAATLTAGTLRDGSTLGGLPQVRAVQCILLVAMRFVVVGLVSVHPIACVLNLEREEWLACLLPVQIPISKLAPRQLPCAERGARPILAVARPPVRKAATTAVRVLFRQSWLGFVVLCRVQSDFLWFLTAHARRCCAESCLWNLTAGCPDVMEMVSGSPNFAVFGKDQMASTGVTQPVALLADVLCARLARTAEFASTNSSSSDAFLLHGRRDRRRTSAQRRAADRVWEVHGIVDFVGSRCSRHHFLR